MEKIFYLSDPHFSHPQVIRKGNRPFTNPSQMDREILTNWKSVVSEEDTVYLLGDLGVFGGDHICHFLKSLPGKKILITGNHDKKMLRKYPELYSCFEEVTIYKEIEDNKRKVVLFHYPISEWNGFYRGWYHVHGHVHNGPDSITDYVHLPKRYNANVEFNDYTPRTLDELIERYKKLNSRSVLFSKT